MAKTNKKDERKRRLLFLIFLFMLTVTIGGTATYAWFTSNRSISVDPLDVNVTTVNGLQISADGVNWSAKVTRADLEGAKTGEYPGATNQLPATLGAVSTSGRVTAGLLDMYYGRVTTDERTGNYMLTTTKQTEEINCVGDTACAGKYYIAFDLFIKTDASAALYIEPGTGASVTEGSADKGLQNATRIAFVVEGTSDPNAATPTVLTMDNATAANVTIFEPHVDSHTASGVTQSNLYYKKYTNYNAIAAGSSQPTVSYDGVKAPITSAIELAQTNATDNASYFQTVTSVPFTSAFANADTGQTNYAWYTTAAPFPAGITKVRVYMWVEGQDVDCENDASGANLTYKLALTQNA